MHRQPLLLLLERYKPHSEQEITHKAAIIDFINRHEQCFERTLQIGHLTASAWLVNKSNDHALLMLHSKLGLWVQPGGHCDGDTDILNVALKEAREESGIEGIEPMSSEIFDIDIHYIPANTREKEHYHYDIRFLLRVTSDETVQHNHESQALKWVGKDKNLLPTQSLSIMRMFDKWLLI